MIGIRLGLAVNPSMEAWDADRCRSPHPASCLTQSQSYTRQLTA